jgi:isocitrate dehydrogenase
MTKDLALLISPEQPYQTSEQFLATLAGNLKKQLSGTR